jgi:NADH:ubiquinone oxidoreductase subunit F (NADH-binding)/NADH:ubiquinone oxidoreductase subunit E
MRAIPLSFRCRWSRSPGPIESQDRGGSKLPSLVHELTLLQEREGWLSEAALRELAERLNLPLHRLESVSSFYTHFRRTPPRRVQLDACRDLSCALAGGSAACARLREAVAGRDDVEIREVSCLGRCDGAPAAAIGHRVLSLASTSEVLAAIDGSEPAADERPATSWGEAEVYAGKGERYGALRAALGGERLALARTLEESGLRGMGGAGFPTGRKWSLVAGEPATPKYVICNADESEPGTFKDREILRDLSHLVIEGMALAAYCVGAERGWVFIRHEYEPERRALQAAIDEAYAAGALGDRVFGGDFRFDVEVFVSPGGYILGEETALLECMEDRRGEPRNKPPYPGTAGLWNRPTLMNNVETFVHATGILHRGVEWWRALGKPGFAGQKFISVSGDVAEPRVVLIPFGTTLGELLERCGGMRDGCRLAAVAPGGASSNFLPADRLDVPIDFETLEEAGSMLGSGAAVFVAEGCDLLEVGLNVTRFFRNESCGKCVPCRVGSEKAVKMVETAGGVSGEARALLDELNATLVRTSICGLGQVALGPLLSILGNFPERIRRE